MRILHNCAPLPCLCGQLAPAAPTGSVLVTVQQPCSGAGVQGFWGGEGRACQSGGVWGTAVPRSTGGASGRRKGYGCSSVEGTKWGRNAPDWGEHGGDGANERESSGTRARRPEGKAGLAKRGSDGHETAGERRQALPRAGQQQTVGEAWREEQAKLFCSPWGQVMGFHFGIPQHNGISQRCP